MGCSNSGYRNLLKDCEDSPDPPPNIDVWRDQFDYLDNFDGGNEQMESGWMYVKQDIISGSYEIIEAPTKQQMAEANCEDFNCSELNRFPAKTSSCKIMKLPNKCKLKTNQAKKSKNSISKKYKSISNKMKFESLKDKESQKSKKLGSKTKHKYGQISTSYTVLIPTGEEVVSMSYVSMSVPKMTNLQQAKNNKKSNSKQSIRTKTKSTSKRNVVNKSLSAKMNKVRSRSMSRSKQTKKVKSFNKYEHVWKFVNINDDVKLPASKSVISRKSPI